MEPPFLLAEGKPSFLAGGPVGCLLLHGFTSMPAEMEPLAQELSAQGYTVFTPRLAGHGSHPRALARTQWTDLFASVEDGLAILRGSCEQVFVLGLSMGGLLALLAADHYEVAGTVAMSTPFRSFSRGEMWRQRLSHWVQPTLDKGTPRAHGLLAERREADYPAYPEFPATFLLELDRLQAAMRAALPRVVGPVLLVHSRDDWAVEPESMIEIYARLGTPDKDMVWLQGFDHALVRDPKRQELFTVITAFLQRVQSGARLTVQRRHAG